MRNLCIFVCAGVFLCASVAVAGAESLKDPNKKTLKVSSVDDLHKAVGSARTGTTILLADGLYRVRKTLVFRTPGVWIRSESGDRDKVILDGHDPKKPTKPLRRENCIGEILAVRASNVVVADLTLRYARDHGIHVFPAGGAGIRNTVMHNIRVYDCGQQLIKVNSYGDPVAWADEGILEDSLLEFVDNSIMQDLGKSFYTGGLDVHGGRDWVICRNVFRNIQRQGKLMEHAIHMWSGCRGTLVERNRFVDCYRAVGFGMKVKPSGKVRTYANGKGKDPYFDHVEGTIRNNFVFNRKGVHLESGFELMNVIDTQVYHNTVVSQDKPFSSIEYRWPNSRVKILNNIVSHNIMERNGAKAELKGNIEKAPASLFADWTKGDLHLSAKATSAIDKGAALGGILGEKEKLLDIDGEERDGKPDVGADEYAD